VLQGKSVLLVDDEESILRALKRELYGWSKNCGMEFLTASSAEEALGVIDENADSIALIVSDLRMPGQKGSELLLRLKDSNPDIPAILLTGYTETQEMMKVIKAGAFSYILKPWDHDLLVSEIEKALQVYLLRKENREYLSMLKKQLSWAGELQRLMFRLDLPPSEKVSFSVVYRPVASLHCGGDYYDVIHLGGERYLILIGDVSGHGIGAAFFVAILKSIIFNEYVRPRVGGKLSPADFLGWLSHRMFPLLQDTKGMIFSFFAAVLDADGGSLRYSNAGHEPAYLIRGKEVRRLHVAGAGIGFVEEQPFVEGEVAIEKGDVMIFFTDGLIETAEGRERLPEKILPDLILSECSHGKGCEGLLEEAKRRLSINEFQDVVTVLTVKTGPRA